MVLEESGLETMAAQTKEKHLSTSEDRSKSPLFFTFILNIDTFLSKF